MDIDYWFEGLIMKYEVMVTGRCYKLVDADNGSEAIDKALSMIKDGDFEVDGVEITDVYMVIECPTDK